MASDWLPEDERGRSRQDAEDEALDRLLALRDRQKAKAA